MESSRLFTAHPHDSKGESMGLLFVDRETGESMIQPLFWEKATQAIPKPVNNAETGEPEVTLNGETIRRRVPFQIPREFKETRAEEAKALSLRRCENLSEIEPVPAGASFGQTNPVFLFLPAIIYFRWFLAVLLVLEVFLHIWAHRKNKFLKDSNVYFRSPFHGISCEFCGTCQSENCSDRVGKMQEVRMHEFLRQCNYMKRVVT